MAIFVWNNLTLHQCFLSMHRWPTLSHVQGPPSCEAQPRCGEIYLPVFCRQGDSLLVPTWMFHWWCGRTQLHDEHERGSWYLAPAKLVQRRSDDITTFRDNLIVCQICHWISTCCHLPFAKLPHYSSCFVLLDHFSVCYLAILLIWRKPTLLLKNWAPNSGEPTIIADFKLSNPPSIDLSLLASPWVIWSGIFQDNLKFNSLKAAKVYKINSMNLKYI